MATPLLGFANSKAAVALSSNPILATGGTITSASGRNFHTFTTNGTFSITSNPFSLPVEVFTVGGGGGGGNGPNYGSGGGAGGAIIAGYLPTSIPTCQLWLDSLDTTSFTFSSGSNITQWRDKSGVGNHFNTSSGTPILKLDGQYSVVGFSSGALMSSASQITFTTSSAFFIVSKLLTISGPSYLLGFTNITTSNLGDYSIRFNNGILNGTPSSTGDVGDLGNSVYFVNGNSNPSFGQGVYYNSYSLIDTVSPTKSGTSYLTLSSAVLSRYFIGNVAEFLYYPYGVTSNQRQTIEGYLTQKWGLTGSLPSSHLGLTKQLYGTFPVSAISTFSVSIGTGGTGGQGSAGSYASGQPGGSTTFGNLYTAYGGGKGGGYGSGATFTYTGSDQSYTVPNGVTSLNVYMWGAGGQGATDQVSSGYGGAGAMVQGVMAVTPGQTLKIIVGQGPSQAYNRTYGGGGKGATADGKWYGSAAGGRSAIQVVSGTDYVVAGGGGGYGFGNQGGAGGLLAGYDGAGGSGAGKGGTQTTGGAGGTTLSPPGSAGSLGNGGDPSTAPGYMGGGYCGGGGGGYYGGGGASGGAGGGGSSYTSNLTLIPGQTVFGYVSSDQHSAPNTSSPYYVSGVAVGGFGSHPDSGGSGSGGGNGLVVLVNVGGDGGCGGGGEGTSLSNAGAGGKGSNIGFGGGLGNTVGGGGGGLGGPGGVGVASTTAGAGGYPLLYYNSFYGGGGGGGSYSAGGIAGGAGGLITGTIFTSGGSYVVPSSVTSLYVYLWGAGGGGGDGGGAGACVQGVLTVSSGETLGIVVGSGGGINYNSYYSPNCGGGGGKTSIQRTGIDVVVAGGGGGGGSYNSSYGGYGGRATYTNQSYSGGSSYASQVLGRTRADISSLGGDPHHGGGGNNVGAGQEGVDYGLGGGGGGGFFNGGNGGIGGYAGGGGSSLTSNLSLIPGQATLGFTSANYSAAGANIVGYQTGCGVGSVGIGYGGNGLVIISTIPLPYNGTTGGGGSGITGSSGQANTGGGGSGLRENGSNAGAGGTGVCIVSYDQPIVYQGAQAILTGIGWVDYIFTSGSQGKIILPRDYTADYLLVAGGGGGGGPYGGGGGGAGGLMYKRNTLLAAGTYTISIGAGGTGGSAYGVNGGNGGNTVFGTISTIGGGGGAATTGTGQAGGSGGGGSSSTAGQGTSGQGTAGGTGSGFASSNYAGGGGGGFTAAGAIGISTIGGDGGAGTTANITGTSVVYSEGGGGGGASHGGPSPSGLSGPGGGALAVLAGTSTGLWLSLDNAVTWTQVISSGIGGAGGAYVVYGSNSNGSMWLAAGGAGSNYYYSSNATSWSSKSAPINICQPVWVPTLNIFIAGCSDAPGASQAATSADGKTWTIINLSGLTAGLGALYSAWNPKDGVAFLTGDTGYGQAKATSDGVSYTTVTRAPAGNNTQGCCVVWVPAIPGYAGRWVAAIQADGVAFSACLDGTLASGVWSNFNGGVGFGRAVAGNGKNVVFAGTGGVNYTFDYSTYTKTTLPGAPTNANTLIWNGSYYIYVGNSGYANVVYRSRDGVTWTSNTISNFGSGYFIGGVYLTYANSNTYWNGYGSPTSGDAASGYGSGGGGAGNSTSVVGGAGSSGICVVRLWNWAAPGLSFVPSMISSNVYWFDAADTSTITTSGSNLTSWSNKGTGSMTFNSISGTITSGTSSQNGRNVISFTASSILTSATTSLAYNGRATYFVVYQKRGNFSTSGTYLNLFSSANSQTFANLNFQIYYSRDFLTNTTFFDQLIVVSSGYNYSGVGNIPPYSTYVYQMLSMDTGVSNKGFWTFGGATTGTGAGAGDMWGAGSTDPGQVGGYWSYDQNPTTFRMGSSPFDWDLAEIIIYSRELNTSERQQVEGYLAWKWGLQSSVVLKHPYANYISPSGGATRMF